MKLLVETHQQPVPELEASLIIGEANRVTDASVSEVFVAEEAIERVLTGRESRADIFTEDELISLRGLERALETGLYDTNGKGMQVIPPDMSKPLLTAMELFAHIPEAERAVLTPEERSRWEIARYALAKMDVVELEPGVTPQDAAVKIVPDLNRYDEVPSEAEHDYSWLYVDTGMKVKKVESEHPYPLHAQDAARVGNAIYANPAKVVTKPEKTGVGVDLDELPAVRWDTVTPYTDVKEPKHKAEATDGIEVPKPGYDDSGRQLFARDDSGAVIKR